MVIVSPPLAPNLVVARKLTHRVDVGSGVGGVVGLNDGFNDGVGLGP